MYIVQIHANAYISVQIYFVDIEECIWVFHRVWCVVWWLTNKKLKNISQQNKKMYRLKW